MGLGAAELLGTGEPLAVAARLGVAELLGAVEGKAAEATGVGSAALLGGDGSRTNT
ncbi:MAG: hypothetical protein JWM64_2684 [Frankiales bacterium]|nr:hypothetical protein [Frankiales bacterium]